MYLQNIYTYPIKSLGGIRLDEAVVEERGLQYDRRWMLVDEKGRFMSQRKHPEMALLQVEIRNDGLFVFHKQKPDIEILIPFEPGTDKLIPVEIWDDRVEAQLVDPEVSRWFTDQLGMDCNLVFMPSAIQRKVDPAYAVNEETVSFADGMPYLLIGQASLDDLNTRLESPVPMNRFRPNLVIAGAQPYEEDDWREVVVGESVFRLVKPCARCVITTTDQEKGVSGKEPLKTLASYRTVDNKVLFGQNMVLIKGEKIRTGESVSFR
ncbi:MOSC domain-containing protein [Rhodohalobacter sp.]|uniref:MOSC domain-containing protein n=1 Tax=Rhodohalobacter sp. TaxID=1974210 RepID=UPI002ACD8C88|nr:MOSC N-terminal beta barrel domain-containing protein [Rhodohalobacter sp.]MDZ7756828.1 MOSC domain-containing protein [Rhodohalobacter sp.]